MKPGLLCCALLAALAGCSRPSAPALIGLGYWGKMDVSQLIVDAPGGTPAGVVRIVSERDVGPIVRSPAADVDYATRLAALPGMAAVVGHGGSREALMTAPIYNEARIPQIIPTATSRRLRQAGPWTFMLAPDDSVEGNFLGQFVAERLQAKSVTLFYVVDEYGAGLRDGLVHALGERGIRVLDQVPVTSGASCPLGSSGNTVAAAVDAALLRGRPDVFVLAARQSESGCVVARIRGRHPDAVFVAGDGLIPTAAFRARAGVRANIHVAAFWHPDRSDSVSRAFVADYRRRFGRTPAHDEAMTYDAMATLATAIREVGSSPARVREFLVALGRTRPPLRGVTGPIAFPGAADKLMMLRLGPHPDQDRVIP